MGLEEGDIQVWRTKIDLPIADLSKTGDGQTYHGRLAASRERQAGEWALIFRRSICQITGDQCHLHIGRRLEFDASPAFDHMIWVLPQNERIRAPQDFNELAWLYPKDATLLIKVAAVVLSQYQKCGCDFAMGVLNTSSDDPGVTFVEGKAVKERLPASRMVTHIKCYGLRKEEVEQDRSIPEETELVLRPLQKQTDAIVAHLVEEEAKMKKDDLPATSFVFADEADFVQLYKKVHKAMLIVSLEALGWPGIAVPSGTTQVAQLEFFRQQGVLGDSLRVEGSQVVANIQRALKKSPEKVVQDTSFEGNQEMGQLIIDYLAGLSDCVTAKQAIGKSVRLVYGPSFSILFRRQGGLNLASFVPADIIRKGANTITGVFPRESRRPLNSQERKQIVWGNNMLRTQLERAFPGKFQLNQFDAKDYFSQFDVER